MRILIDGLNFELQRGTGIKTFTRSVITALHSNGDTIDLLSQLSMPKVNRVFPLDAYLASAIEIGAPGTSRLRIRDRMLRHLGLYGRSFKGDIILREMQGLQALVRYQGKGWDYLDRIRVVPGLFLRSFARAGLRLGITNIPYCADSDVMFLTSPIPVRLQGRLNVLTVHDVIPLSHPWLMDRWSGIARVVGNSLEYALKVADRVICVSETSKLELLNRFDVDDRKIHVVYQPCRYALPSDTDDLKDNSAEKGGQALLQGAGLTSEPYILFVGAIEPKKNLFNLLKAVQQDKKLPKLIVVGPFAWSSDRERALIGELRGRVQYVGYLPDGELEAILENSSAFVFPSITEGFGLPALEAMWKGVPCVLSDIPVFRELFADHAEYVDPYDPKSISEAIHRAIHHNAIRIEASRSHVREKFSLARFKRELGHVIHQ